MQSTWLLNDSIGRMPVRFCVGDSVEVLSSIHLPKFEHAIHAGTVERITEREGLETLYWISGRGVAQTARTLRLVQRAR